MVDQRPSQPGIAPQPLRIGSRGSALALVQARLVEAALARAGIDSSITVITTDGDLRAADTPWGEGAFVTAIEAALRDDRIDVAVHSAKDLPTDEDLALPVAAFLPRASADDVLVLPVGASPITSLADLPPGARVGTDSPRRTAFLRASRPDLAFQRLHGNVDTRLRRLDAGDADAIVLAAAGLDRLGRSDRISLRLDPSIVPPAPGQGALAVQVRASDSAARDAVRTLDDPATRRAVEAERALLAATGGGCRAPIGAFARETEHGLHLIGGYARQDGTVRVVVDREAMADPDGSLVRAVLHELADEAALAAIGGDGARVIVTRAADQSSALVLSLVDRGLAPLSVPAIEIVPGDEAAIADAIGRLSSFDWVAVTSSNTVESLAAAARDGGTTLAAVAGPRLRWAAVGAATKRALAGAGIKPTWVPSRSSADALADALPVTAGERVLFPRSDLAELAPAERLVARGVAVEAPVAYRTIEGPAPSISLLDRALPLGPSATVLTSGSTARGLLALADHLGARELVLAIPAVCLGPETALHAKELGYRVAAVEPMQRVGAIADLVVRAIAETESRHTQVEVAL